MQISLPLLAIVALLLGIIVPGLAQTLTVFGDSLSDSGLRPTGGGFAKWTQMTLQTNEVYPQQPYSNGRYSNGPVWVDQASQSLGISYVNWAAGGATSGAGLSQAGPLPVGFAGYPTQVTVLAPNLHQQVEQYLGTVNGTANSSDVYVIFIGNNDYFSISSTKKNISADDVVENIETVMDQLYTRGAQRFILVTIPPVAALPASLRTNPALVEAWSEHNDILKAMGSDFNSTHPGSTVSFFDFGGLVLQILGNAATYGFTSASPCYATAQAGVGLQSGIPLCTNPTQHFLWDSVHPTTTAHTLVAKAFVQQYGSLWGKTLSPAPAPGASSN